MPRIRQYKKICDRCGRPRVKWKLQEGRKPRLVCVECIREKDRERDQKPYRRHKKSIKASGLLPENIDTLYDIQAHACAICKRKTVLVLDHCHSCLKPRALLCGYCNRGLGFFYDNPNLLMTASAYLRGYCGPVCVREATSTA